MLVSEWETLREKQASSDDDDIKSTFLKRMMLLSHYLIWACLRRICVQVRVRASGSHVCLVAWLPRFPPEFGKAPGLHGADPRSREGSVQSPEDPKGHAQVRPHLPRLSRGPDHGQEQGQGEFKNKMETEQQLVTPVGWWGNKLVFWPDLQNAGGQSSPGYSLRRPGRGHERRDGNREPSQAGGPTAAAGG